EKGSEKSSEKILKLMHVDPQISAQRIAEQLKISPRAVEKQIAQLKKQGLIIRIGAAKGGCWKVLSK
ncbi:MAG: HTH domain-containing protein, partial [Mariprofundus sp.]|nr:HTH domain-containing protein [Mariprofundus sp.]